MQDILTELSEASAAMTRIDERRQKQQDYRDELIRRAINAGIGYNAIKRASGLRDRSLQLAIKRTAKSE